MSDHLRLGDKPRCRLTRRWCRDASKIIEYIGSDGNLYGCIRGFDGAEQWFAIMETERERSERLRRRPVIPRGCTWIVPSSWKPAIMDFGHSQRPSHPNNSNDSATF
jgi:hypothetical protein